jgi:soluble lytic murein transglycosylase
MLRRFLLVTALASCSVTAHARSDVYKHAREDFVEAYTQATTTGGEPQKPDREDLRTYPLYPYLQSARIKRALNEASVALSTSLGSVDQRAQTFATYYEREAVGRDLRRAWLLSLAERDQWATFLDQYRDAIADDALRCHNLTARIELGRTEGLVDDVSKQWLTPRSLPECERAFDWLRQQNALTPELIEQRARRALEDGNVDFARQIVAMLPADRAAPYRQWLALIDSPQRQIDILIGSPDQPVLDDALLAGWSRLCRVSRDAAIDRYDALIRARKLDESKAAPYALALALALAWDRRPEALTYFKRLTPPTLDDYALEWQTRAAMWAEDWPLVARSIASMSDAQRGPRAMALLGGARGGAVERPGAGSPALRVRAHRRQLLLCDGGRTPGPARRAASPEADERLEAAEADRAASRARARARAAAQQPEESGADRMGRRLLATLGACSCASCPPCRAMGLVRPGDRSGDAAARLQ